MSTPTEAHRALVTKIRQTESGSEFDCAAYVMPSRDAAQLLADSEARAVEAVTEQRDVLRYLLSQIFQAMPAKRDWLDPVIEKAAKHGMKELPTVRDLSERVRVLEEALKQASALIAEEWRDKITVGTPLRNAAVLIAAALATPERKEGSG